jgi:hypothetical protein
MHPATVDLIRLIAADMLAGCPHDPVNFDDDECPECRARLDEDTAEYRAYTYR